MWEMKSTTVHYVPVEEGLLPLAKMSVMYQGRDLRSGGHVFHSSRKAQSHVCHAFQSLLVSTLN